MKVWLKYQVSEIFLWSPDGQMNIKTNGRSLHSFHGWHESPSCLDWTGSHRFHWNTFPVLLIVCYSVHRGQHASSMPFLHFWDVPQTLPLQWCFLQHGSLTTTEKMCQDTASLPFECGQIKLRQWELQTVAGVLRAYACKNKQSKHMNTYSGRTPFSAYCSYVKVISTILWAGRTDRVTTTK